MAELSGAASAQVPPSNTLLPFLQLSTAHECSPAEIIMHDCSGKPPMQLCCTLSCSCRSAGLTLLRLLPGTRGRGSRHQHPLRQAGQHPGDFARPRAPRHFTHQALPAGRQSTHQGGPGQQEQQRGVCTGPPCSWPPQRGIQQQQRRAGAATGAAALHLLPSFARPIWQQVVGKSGKSGAVLMHGVWLHFPCPAQPSVCTKST